MASHHHYMHCGLSIIIVWLSYSSAVAVSDNVKLGPIVTLTQGQVQGSILTTDSGQDYLVYRGIPYATQQRFRHAGPPPSWDGVRDGSIFGSICPQMSFTTGKPEGSEDCLFINVATPMSKSSSENEATKKPTILYIHGGGFQGGSGGQSGPDYWMDNGAVVFLTFNYRLGPFGFLNMGNDQDNDVMGINPNLGLKDQTAALLWVQENIEAFGGMKENVTLFGGSAGAASVSLHILSETSKGLFSRAISGSGSALCPWAIDTEPGINAKLLVQHLGCDLSGKEEDMKKCLLEKPFQDFLGAKSPDSEIWSLDPVTLFQPSVEKMDTSTTVLSSSSRKRFLRDNPATLLTAGNFNKVPWIGGITNQEGLALHAAIILNNLTLVAQLNDNWENVAPITLSLGGGIFPKNTKMSSIVNKIRQFYFGDDKISPQDLKSSTKLQELYSDRNFFTGVRDTILLHAKHAPVYPYVFDYMDPNAMSWLTTLMGLNISGVAHSDDFAYYFKFYMDPNNPASGIGLEPNTSAKEMSKKLIKLLVSFAKNGVPEVWEDAEQWPKCTQDSNSMKWYHIDKNPTLKVESDEFKGRMDFWANILSSSHETLSHSAGVNFDARSDL